MPHLQLERRQQQQHQHDHLRHQPRHALCRPLTAVLKLVYEFLLQETSERMHWYCCFLEMLSSTSMQVRELGRVKAHDFTTRLETHCNKSKIHGSMWVYAHSEKTAHHKHKGVIESVVQSCNKWSRSYPASVYICPPSKDHVRGSPVVFGGHRPEQEEDECITTTTLQGWPIQA